ncbi:MAG: geranylgeranylglyceryl/heptaprenylglyceryl phosphate synthase [Candidatus Bathyarchaeia archaeon]
MVSRVEQLIQERIRKEGCIHMTLLDPEKKSGYDCAVIARDAEAGGTAAIMVGGSTVASGVEMEDVVKRIKANVRIPVIIFPNNIASITGAADAMWFMSLLNSANTYYLIDSQAIGAPMVKKLGLETMPMGYIIVGYGGAAGYVGQARVIPYDRPELAVAYASAAELLGMRYIYLEAGSGAPQPVSPIMISAVSKYCKSTLVVGGGIRDAKAAIAAKIAGAQIIVTGTLVEEESKVMDRIREITTALTAQA